MEKKLVYTGKTYKTIVVPTGFITAQSGIEKAIRQRIIDRKWLRGVISMPSNIFANPLKYLDYAGDNLNKNSKAYSINYIDMIENIYVGYMVNYVS